MNAETFFRTALGHFQTQRWPEAFEAATRACELKPEFVDAWSARAMASERLGRWAEAELAYQQVISFRPAFAEAHCNLGGAYLKLTRWVDAETSFAKALAFRPIFPEAHNGLGVARKQLGELARAVESFQSALTQRPAYAEGLFNLANTFQAQENWTEAVRIYQQALALNPRSVETRHNLACAQIGLHAFAEAMTALERVIAQQPENADAYNHLGNALLGLNRFADAALAYERALALRPDFVDARCNLGNVALAQNQPERALDQLRAAAMLAPHSTSVEFNTSIALLVSGQWREGFEKYERRWETEQKSFRKQHDSPLWLGRESLAGKTILLWSEQGIGDTLQFVRYAPMITARGATVLLQVPPPLKELLRNFPGVARVYSKTESTDKFDFHCPLGSLPLALSIEPDAIGANTPYLFSKTEKGEDSSKKFTAEFATNSFRVGLVCSGNARHKNDEKRSIPLPALAEIARAVGEPLHLIQKDLRGSDAEFLARHAELFTNWSESLKDFTDTAALIDCLDLVITVDTSVAHLAGAMGKPTWILLPFAPDWRWLLNREDTPWYPTARLFRQQSPGDWRSVLEKVVSELRPFTDRALAKVEAQAA